MQHLTAHAARPACPAAPRRARAAKLAAALVLAGAPAGAGARQDPPPSGLTIVVHVPAYRVDVTDGDSTWSYRVAVGQPRYPTPTGAFRLREVVWNPWWVPPPSAWARRERVTPPGPDNPMGRVKMQFAALVFLHGTPAAHSLGSAASHACVRMANADAIALARLVHRRAIPGVPEAAVDSALADSTRARRFAVARAVPVTVRYDLAEVRRDTLWLYPDVYGRRADRRAEAMRALAGAGADTTAVGDSVLSAALRGARRRAAAVPLPALAPRP